MRTIENLLSEYSESHQNPTNKLVHWVCVPVIVWTTVALWYCVKLPFQITPTLQLNGGIVLIVITLIYYLRLSWTLSIGMLIYSSACLWICQQVELSGMTLWKVALSVFVLAWIGQFWGHKVEGKKPSFLKDVQFLMIGPAWLMSFIYKKVGIAI
jgi:uncharacterized membrane protein YGL010W